jgi:hypothetical protein
MDPPLRLFYPQRRTLADPLKKCRPQKKFSIPLRIWQSGPEGRQDEPRRREHHFPSLAVTRVFRCREERGASFGFGSTRVFSLWPNLPQRLVKGDW